MLFMTGYRYWLAVILVITLVCAYIDLPDSPGVHIGDTDWDFEVVQGLDLQGGSRVLLKAALDPDQYESEDMEVARDIVERRVNGLGLAETTVQLQGNDRILVELPGVSDRDVALQTVQGTGLLEFVDFSGIPASIDEGACILTTEQQRIEQERQQNTQQDQQLTPTPLPPDAQPTTEPTTERTPDPRPFGKVDMSGGSGLSQGGEGTPTPEATELATAEPTEQATAEATVEATPEPTEVPTEQPTAEPTAEVTPEATTTPEAPAQEDNAERGPCPDGSFPIGTNGQPGGPAFTTVMTGAGLKDAAAVAGNFSQWTISFTLNEEGDQIFGDFTSSHVNQRLAIVLDGVVISAPNIQQAITTGQGQITGNFSRERARVLATQLRYGALPVPLEVDAFDNVGPTLGKISIDRSIRAGVIGVIVVLLFMLIYYRVPGIAAVLALSVFGLINFALYKTIPVTLTLSAITGFLISIGTAVDGNILIFERMKEELRAGRPLERAVEQGFARAFSSIFYSNLSTGIICTILWFFGRNFGASAVQGFAITLGLGLFINLFTALIVTRTFLSFILDIFGDSLRGNKRLMGA
ncbi:MAG: protein translocase subunit SecD [Chloroflexi bacterium]|nr:protein translocase subunit SecD [Chloroflexota bacterium]